MTKKTIDDFVTDKKTLDNIISRYVSEINFSGIGSAVSASNSALSTMGKVAGEYTPSGLVASYASNKINNATSPKIGLLKGLGKGGINPAGLVFEIVRAYLARKFVGSTPEERQVVTSAAKKLIEEKIKAGGIPTGAIKSFAVEVIKRVLAKESLLSEEDKGAPDVPFGPYNFNTTNRDMKTHVTLATEDNEEEDTVVEPTPKVKALTQGNKKILTDPPADDDDELDSIDFNDSIDSEHSNGVGDDDDDLEEQITIIQHAKKESKKEKEETPPPEPADAQQGMVQQDPEEQSTDSKTPNAQGGFDPSQVQSQDDYQGDEDLGIDPDNSDPEGGEDPNAMQDPNATAGQDPNMAGAQDPNAMQDPNAAAGQDPNAMGMDPNAAAGQDPNAMGSMGMDPNAPLPGAQNAEQIGRTFELKKIYNRLIAIETYLSFSTEPILLKIEQYTAKAIELFELVMTNIQMYQDKVDDIVVTYYKFLEKIYEVIKQYYALKQEKENDENNEDDENQKGEII